MAGIPFPNDEKFAGVLPVLSADNNSTYIFFGHSAICYDTSRVSAEINKVKLPNNVIVVTFGHIGNTNAFQLQKLLDTLARSQYDRNMLMDPLTDRGEDIEEWLNAKLADKGFPKTSITVSIGVEIPEFFGIPFSYVNQKGTDTLFTSGLYDLETIRTSKWKEIYQDSTGTLKVNFDSLRSDVFTPPPIFPSKERVDYVYEAFKKQPETEPQFFSLSDWYKVFDNPAYQLILTPATIFKIASEYPEQWHIFYLPSCRSLSATSEVSGAYTRGLTRLITKATRLGQEKEEEASKIYVSERQQTLVRAFLDRSLSGGGRRRKRKVKKTSKRKVLRKRTIRKKR